MEYSMKMIYRETFHENGTIYMIFFGECFMKILKFHYGNIVRDRWSDL